MRGANPYYANEGRYAGVGQAVGNLGQLFVEANDPRRAAQADALGWRARGDREGVIDAQRARGARDDLAQQFLEMDPNTYDPRQTLAAAVGGNVYDPNEIGDLFRVSMANVPGFSDNQVARSVVGAGGDIGVDDAFSLPGQQNIADRNFGYDMAQDAQSQAADYTKAIDLQNQKPLSRDQMIGSLFAEQGPEAAQEAVQAMYASGGRTGGVGGDAGVDWLAATRQADLEGDVDQLVVDYVNQLGVDPNNVPPDMYGEIAAQVMQGVQQGGSPRALLNQAMQGYDVQEDNGIPFVPFTGGDPELVRRTQPQSMPVVISDEDYEALPSGSVFQDESGQRFTKP